MGFLKATGMKEYEKLAARNSGDVAILVEARAGKKSPEKRVVLMVNKPRQFSIKMNELKMFLLQPFEELYPERDEHTYCRFAPVDGEFIRSDDFITLKSTGESIRIKKVPYYLGLIS